MEEDGGVKAPVTRLQRRLSVEQSEDTMSPSAPSTPTKKRGRLAAKPQLELIDENAPQNSPKKTTRKSMAKDVEPAEKSKPVTPSRRATRAKSNTSLVMEMEAIQNLDSPRAKRAARRNSQAGSDNEAPLTPARTRRTRKDSTSSVEKLAIESSVTPGRTRRTRKDSTSSAMQADNEPASKPALLITEVISEEPEMIDQQATISGVPEEPKDQNSSNSPRKSPRLQGKKEKSTSRRSNNENNNLSQENKSATVTSSEKFKSNDVLESVSSGNSSKLENNTDGNIKSSDLQKNRLSTCPVNLTKSLNSEGFKKVVSLNKSTSAINDSNRSDSKRHRTKSWTSLTVPSSNDKIFFSDNESTKKKIKLHENSFNMRLSNRTGSGDSDSKSIDDTEKTLIGKDNIEIILNSSSKKKRIENSNKIDKDSIVNESFNANKSNDLNVSVTGPSKIAVADISNESNKENLDEIHSKNHKLDAAQLLFQKPINTIIQSMVFIEDSDSNTDSIGKKQIDGEDQCVPVVDHELKIQDTINIQNQDFIISEQEETNNCSCEPMDIDETIPDNFIINDSATHKLDNDETEEKGSGSSISNLQTAVQSNANKNSNKTKRKSSASNSILQDHEKSSTENRSTLVLSQIKDSSDTEHNMSKSFQESNNELLSKSVNLPNVAKEEIVNQNLSLNCLTSTPVQHKDVKKLNMQMNTSVITPCKAGKNEIIDTKKSSKKELSKTSNNSDTSGVDSEDDEEMEKSSQEKNEFLEDQAEDAGEDYESGDSQDEEERKYENDHEIVEHGETLTSEDEVTNDSDYEKDSFVVSSDEDDNDLLSGSGDDLDMSDNELTMAAKSKKKFNERSIKQQKSASKEMFEARHNIKSTESNSNKNQKLKNKRRRLDSSLLESEDDNSLPPKKNKRMRLDSTWESSMTKSEDDEVVSRDKNTSEAVSDTSEIGLKMKKKVNRLSDSICESEFNEIVVDSHKKDSTIDKACTDETEHENKKKSKRLSKSIISENSESAASESVKGEVRRKTGKRLSESVHNESILNEKEITICDKSIEKDDPLLTAVKQEPKTPNKGLEISTIQFSYREDIEQVNVNENVSIMKPNVSLDPLLTTTAQEGEDDSSINEESDNSSISENEEITNNYDTILNELNNDFNRKQIKSFDMSLNLNRKTKKKVIEPIIAELNITQTKTPNNKNKKKKEALDVEITDNKLQSVVNKIPNSSDDDETTNEAIQLRLLFSEDSNDSSKSNSTGNAEVDEHFIPLKRSKGKTNIPMSANEVEEKDSSLNISSKKKNKKLNLSQNDDISNANASEIVDESSLNISSSKKNKMRKSLQNEDKATNENQIGKHETSLNNSNKKKNKKLKSSQNEDADSTIANSTEIVNESTLNNIETVNKFTKSTQNDDNTAAANANGIAENEPVSLNTSSNNKKKRKSRNEDATASASEIVESLNTSFNRKNKIPKSMQDDSKAINASEIVEKESLNTSINKKNKKPKSMQDDYKPINASEIVEKESLNTSINKKNKKPKSMQDDYKPINASEIVEKESLNTSINKKNKKPKSMQDDYKPINASEIVEKESLNTSINKKNKKPKSMQDDYKPINASEIVEKESLNTSINKKNKKPKSMQDDYKPIISDASKIVENESLNTKSNKKTKKRKSSLNEDVAAPSDIKGDNKNFFVDTIGTHMDVDTHVNDSLTASPKKKPNLIYFANDDEKPVPSDLEKKTGNKKRKDRDDDYSVTRSKILKQSSFDEIIPRLPATIINCLEDKPRKVFDVKKSTAVSTTEFLVENNRRKNKPSDFLEQTVYLNSDTESPEVKKAHIKKPKVLPFIPTASTSHSGFTTNFKVNVIPQKMEFVAQNSDVSNFKNDYLYNKKIKKLRTYELYRQHRNVKLSKF